ncbi:MAG: prolyl oligopeptidase family serine peptidase [Candidatus Acidiferrales bacterium]
MHRVLKFCAAACLVLFLCCAAIAAPDSKKPWKPEDVVMTESANEVRISPDGQWAVWAKSTPDKEKDVRVSNLILSSLTGKKEIPLTRGSDDVSNPRWSPNGELIGFLFSRAVPNLKPSPSRHELGKPQLWLLNRLGGEPWAATEFERGIRHFEWLDNDTIIFSAEEDPSLYERQLKEKKDDTNVVDDSAHTAPVRLFRLSIQDKKVSRLTNNDDWIGAWDLSPDGKWAVTVNQRELSYAWDQKIPPATNLVNLTTGESRPLFAGGKIRPRMVRWARDNSGLYAVAPFTDDPRFYTATIELVYFYDLASGQMVKVDLGWENGIGSSLEITPDGFLTLLEDGVHFKPARYTRRGATWSREFLEGQHDKNYFSLSLSGDARTLVYSYSTASIPTQLYQARLDGARVTDAVQFSDLNPLYQDRIIAKTEVIHWKGANGDPVEGILYYPHDYHPGRLYPLITATHGGPSGADHDAWSESYAYSQNLLNQRGAFVLKTNYHGSSGYGLKWVESICCGKFYELEIPDIEKGVDYLIGRGLIDPDRIGALGWSNGAILSIQLMITNPSRYKAAAVGAGDVEWISDWANVDFGQAFDSYYFGKSPLEDPELYIRKSPIFQMDKVRTPTLNFFGGADRNVPTEEGWTHYRTLYTIGKVPVRFMLFPGEPHGPRKLSHQLRKVTEEMAWFDQYLFKTGPAMNEAFKKGSPLDIVLERQSIQKRGNWYGVEFRPPSIPENPPPSLVIPELVRYGDLEVGRFEVTRAQYAAFDKAYKFAPGTENYPASAIPFEKAKAYAAWLADMTAEAFRLPTEQEGAKLYSPRAGENTLDYWAGYTLNPEDAHRLEEKVSELTGNAPLLKEVGSFSPAGVESGALVFDLGGNVAEWVTTQDGAGKTMGGSADRASDPKARYAPADILYTGFRVVRGATGK